MTDRRHRTDITPAPPSPNDTQPTQPPKGGDGNRSDPPGYAEYETERDAMGRGKPVPTQRSPVVPAK